MVNRGNMREQIFPTRRLASHDLQNGLLSHCSACADRSLFGAYPGASPLDGFVAQRHGLTPGLRFLNCEQDYGHDHFCFRGTGR
jgi:hypothetical protein